MNLICIRLNYSQTKNIQILKTIGNVNEKTNLKCQKKYKELSKMTGSDGLMKASRQIYNEECLSCLLFVYIFSFWNETLTFCFVSKNKSSVRSSYRQTVHGLFC